MSAATFKRRRLGRDVLRFVVDCEHGTTVGDLVLGGGRAPTDGEVLAALAALHEGEERCGCARRLLAAGQGRRWEPADGPLSDLSAADLLRGAGRTTKDDTAGPAASARRATKRPAGGPGRSSGGAA